MATKSMPIVSCRSNGLRDCDLGAHPVRGTREHGLRISGEIELEQSGKPAKSGQQFGPLGTFDRRLHQFDGAFSRFDVYAGRGIRRLGAAGHGRDRASSAA